MITPDFLLPLWSEHRDAIKHPIESFAFPKFNRIFDDKPYQMGVINLSRHSTYRESICHTVEGALYRARRMTIEGAAMIDIGAESTDNTADLLNSERQIASLVPVVKSIADEGMLVSAETYHTDVAVAALEAGAGVINLTGRIDDRAFYEAVAKHQAGIIFCYTPGENARTFDDPPPAEELVQEQLLFFKERIAMATDAGVERLWVDPGFGLALNLPDGPERVRYQTEGFLQAFRFRQLGWPVCVTMCSSVYLFHDEVRCAETATAVLALLSKANLLRSHEVARCEPVLNMLAMSS